MIDWVTAALLAFFLLGGVNILDKILRHKVKHTMSLLLLTAFADSLIVAVALANGFVIPEFPVLVVGILAGILGTVAFFPFLKALYEEEVSRLIPMYNLVPVFVLTMSILFLNEALTSSQYQAFALILLGGILISLKNGEGLLGINKRAVLFMAASSFLYALQVVLSKYVFLNMQFLDGLILIAGSRLLVVAAILANQKTRKDAEEDFSKAGKSILLLFIVIGLLGTTLFYYAIMNGSASIVSVLNGFQMVFVFLIATALSVLYPKLLREELGKRNLLLKAVAMLLMIAGLVLIYL